MEIAEIRRSRLREWFAKKTLPVKEKSYLSQLMNGKASFGERSARRLERDYGMESGYLDRPREVAAPDHSNVSPGPAVNGCVPLISWVAAGRWTEIHEAPEIEQMVPSVVRCGPRTFALRVRGDSMQPEFPDGYIVIVDPDAVAEPGSFVIARNGNNEATFKQLIKDGAEFFLKPLNDRYPINTLGSSEIIGVVKFSMRDVWSHERLKPLF